MTEFLQSVFAGIGQGSVYGLIALGFVIIYKSTLVVSFAQPALMLAGATAMAIIGEAIGFWPAIPIAIAITVTIAMTAERVALRPMVGQPVFVAAIITIGLDVAIRVVVNRFLGITTRFVPAPWPFQPLEIGGVRIAWGHIWAFVTTMLVLAALFAFFKFSRFGLGMRAAAFDQETALAQGVNVGRVFSVSWGIAGGLAALAGLFIGAEFGVESGTWVIALKALPAIIIGGLDSIAGGVIGALAVGVFEQLFARYQADWAPWLGSDFSGVSPYVLLLIVLLIRPYGLFGTPEVERV